MKLLAINIAKGGVGKTMLACQLARYTHHQGLRVLVDLDDQGSSSKSLMRDGVATAMSSTITQIFLDAYAPPQKYNKFSLVAADGKCGASLVERSHVKETVDGEEQEKYLIANGNFNHFLQSVDQHFDLCVADCPPGSDVRISMVLSATDFCISPIQLAQESFEGMAETLNGFRGVLRIKEAINPDLTFIGFLPNMVEKTAKQIEALHSLGQKMGQYFMLDGANCPYGIPKRESLSNAQGRGMFIGDLAKTNTAARDAWAKTRIIFDEILKRCELSPLMEEIKKERAEEKSKEEHCPMPSSSLADVVELQGVGA